jgi:hypothetical protein
MIIDIQTKTQLPQEEWLELFIAIVRYRLRSIYFTDSYADEQIYLYYYTIDSMRQWVES